MHGFKCRWRRDKLLRHLAANFTKLGGNSVILAGFPVSPNEKTQTILNSVTSNHASTRIRKHMKAQRLSHDGCPKSRPLFLAGHVAVPGHTNVAGFYVLRQIELSTKNHGNPKPRSRMLSVFPAFSKGLNRLNPPLTHHQLASIRVFSLRCDVWADLELTRFRVQQSYIQPWKFPETFCPFLLCRVTVKAIHSCKALSLRFNGMTVPSNLHSHPGINE